VGGWGQRSVVEEREHRGFKYHVNIIVGSGKGRGGEFGKIHPYQKKNKRRERYQGRGGGKNRKRHAGERSRKGGVFLTFGQIHKQAAKIEKKKAKTKKVSVAPPHNPPTRIQAPTEYERGSIKDILKRGTCIPGSVFQTIKL